MKNEVIKFKIEHLDPLGQGVSKLADKICFIPKTLPGEEGTAEITGKKKGIFFAQVKDLSNKSTNRAPSECPHFDECSGCSYLHTDYKTELLNKQHSFERQLNFSSFKESKLTCHGAPERFGYRNRIQLHYDKPRKQLGFFKGKSKSILNVSNCKLPTAELQQKLKELYKNDNWLNVLPSDAPKTGHIEIYQHGSTVSISWNERYSSGGFSQVNQPMNELALKLWDDFYTESSSPKKILDVFGGSGNLTREFIDSDVTIIDSYCDESRLLKHQSFKKTDLYKDPLIPKLNVDLMIFDPPRSGFKEMASWCEEINPKFIGYQSCFSDTMLRDLKSLSSKWKVHGIHLLDFFPATHHYESIIFLRNVGL